MALVVLEVISHDEDKAGRYLEQDDSFDDMAPGLALTALCATFALVVCRACNGTGFKRFSFTYMSISSGGEVTRTRAGVRDRRGRSDRSNQMPPVT